MEESEFRKVQSLLTADEIFKGKVTAHMKATGGMCSVVFWSSMASLCFEQILELYTVPAADGILYHYQRKLPVPSLRIR